VVRGDSSPKKNEQKKRSGGGVLDPVGRAPGRDMACASSRGYNRWLDNKKQMEAREPSSRTGKTVEMIAGQQKRERPLHGRTKRGNRFCEGGRESKKENPKRELQTTGGSLHHTED